MPRWGELQLETEDREARLISLVAANPVGVDMDRVASSMRGIRGPRRGPACAGRRIEAIAKISKTPPAPTWLFTLARRRVPWR